mmetsp:Transcript_5079/g.14861  ORF Transcript_5079/g.14861 Transcript_5079/m.14861 type:complete len:146 (+) Transcript_5079:491-928(+)
MGGGRGAGEASPDPDAAAGAGAAAGVAPRGVAMIRRKRLVNELRNVFDPSSGWRGSSSGLRGSGLRTGLRTFCVLCREVSESSPSESESEDLSDKAAEKESPCFLAFDKACGRFEKRRTAATVGAAAWPVRLPSRSFRTGRGETA